MSATKKKRFSCLICFNCGLYRLVSMLLCVVLFLSSLLFKSPWCGSRLPGWKRGCRGTTGQRRAVWSTVWTSTDHQALRQWMADAWTGAQPWQWKQRWWTVWQRMPASRGQPWTPSLGTSSRLRPPSKPTRCPGTRSQHCCQWRCRQRRRHAGPEWPPLC